VSGPMSSTPRPFVVLRHDPPFGTPQQTHWDLMLDTEAALRTWALAQFPVWNAPVAAKQLPDHRRAYLTYEGPVSGNRGSVTRVLAGTYELQLDTAQRIECRLHATQFAARLILTRDTDHATHWMAGFHALTDDA